MSLYDDPEHTIDLYAPLDATKDTGGGVKLNYATTPNQADTPCIIATYGASMPSVFDQKQLVVRGRIGILTETLTVTPTRGWKGLTTDTGRTILFLGISPGRAYGGIPAFTYFDCEEWLIN